MNKRTKVCDKNSNMADGKNPDKHAPKGKGQSNKKRNSGQNSASDYIKPSNITIFANADIGFGNRLYIRGSGYGLDWNTGIEMTPVGDDCWKWESASVYETVNLEFKVLINDAIWSAGNNFVCNGDIIEVTPSF